MTIVQAIQAVLSDEPDGLTSREIYEKIVTEKRYNFGAKDPVGVVNGQIRRRCMGLDFPTAYPVKLFQISGRQGKKYRFSLYNEMSPIEKLPVKTKDSAEQLPEEKIEFAYRDHLVSVKQQVLECVLGNSSDFFERLVVDLLLKMGYGYDNQSGEVVGGPHDGGIDGVIREDKLGLDLLYIQAKRYSDGSTIGRKELQAFIGAMKNIQKGVFITTSSFTEPARRFIEKDQQQKSIKLIDGDLLSELLVKYEVGVLPAQKISIYKIDTNYFNT